MKIYVASKFEEYERVREVQAQLIQAGHTITYDWTRCDKFDQEQATLDLNGVLLADALVLVVEKDLPYRGAYVEFGIAIVQGIPVYILGNAADECIFTKLPNVRRGLEGLAV